MSFVISRLVNIYSFIRQNLFILLTEYRNISVKIYLNIDKIVIDSKQKRADCVLLDIQIK